MAKKGLDYFSFDVNFFDNDKIALVEAEFGIKGIMVVIKLLCKIYSEGYYIEWGKDQCLLFTSRRLKPSMPDITATYTQKVVDYLLRRGFFNQEIYNKYHVLTSRNIQERYHEAVKRRQKLYINKDFWLLKNEENVCKNEENVCKNEENVCNFSQSKVKESKVKESKYNNHPQYACAHARGGGNKRNLYDELCNACNIREDVWEAVALSNFFMNDKAANYEEWLSLSPEQRKGYPLYQLNNAIRAQSPPIDTQPYHALCWCKDTCLDAEWREIYRLSLIHADELPKLVKECKKGKINLPGKFIISRLKAL